MRPAILCAALLMAGCAAPYAPYGPPLVSAQYPPNDSRNSEPQPIGSLPLGAANIGTAPGALQPNFLNLTLGVR